MGTEYMNTCELKHWLAPLAMLDLTIACWIRNSAACRDPPKAVQNSFKWLAIIDFNKQTEEMKNYMELLPSIAQLVLGIYADLPSCPINDEALDVIFECLPFPPGVKRQEPILEYLMKMIMNARFANYRGRICFVFTELLVLPALDLMEYAYPEVLLKKMRWATKKLITDHPELLGEVTSRMANPKRDRPLLDDLIK
jgi:hypothetical protein